VEFVTIGTIVRSFGIKGEVKVIPLSENPHRFKPSSKVFIRNKKGEQKYYTIERIRKNNKFLYIKFLEVINRNQADALKESDIVIPKTMVETLPDGEYYHFELIGLSVEDHCGKEVGVVTSIEEYPEQVMLVVKKEDKKHLIPIVRAHIKDIDIPNKKIILNNVEGLLEL